MLQKFLADHKDFKGVPLKRALYIFDGDEEFFILEGKEYKGNRKVYVFRYCLGYFSECYTEMNTFDQYLILIPVSVNAEYTTF